MNKKIAIVGMIVALFVAGGVAAAMNATKISNFVKEKTQSPLEYYQMVEKNNRDAAVKGIEEQVNDPLSVLSGEEKSGSMDLSFQAGDAIKPMLNHVGLNNLSVHTQYSAKDGATNSTSVIKANNKEAFTLNQYSNIETGEVYMQIPEFAEDYVGLQKDTIQSQGEEILKSYQSAESICKVLGEEGMIKNLLTKYTDIIIDHVKKVEKSQDKIKAAEISQSCTKLKVIIENNQAQKIAKALVKALKDDKDIKRIIESVDKDSYDEYSLLIDSMEEEMNNSTKDSKSKEKLVMDVYVDDAGIIVGREITLASKKEQYTLRQFNAKDGEKIGTLMEVQNPEGIIISVKGQGKIVSNKLSEKITVSVDESLNENPDVITDTKDMITLAIKDMDLEKAKKGQYSGSYKLSTDKIKPLALYSLGFQISGNAKKSKMVVDLFSGKTSMATFAVECKQSSDKAGTIENPANNKKIYDITKEEQLSEYVSKIDISKFVEDLKNNTGVDLTQYINSLNPTLDGGV